MDRLIFYPERCGVDRIELRDPAETLSIRGGGPWERSFLEFLGTLLHRALGMTVRDGGRAEQFL
jgi:hypothetical protein